MRKTTRYAALAFLATGLAFGGYTIAQVDTADDTTVTRTTDTDTDYGWLGLIGLLGLAGLAKRRSDVADRRTATTVR